MPPTLHTQRLDLVPGAEHHLAAELDGPDALARALGVRVPAEWPPDLYGRDEIEMSLVTVQNTPEEDAGWLFYYLLLREDGDGRPTAIGVGGFKGPPEEGGVEVGYSVLSAYRRRGYASEALNRLLGAAFADSRVQRVYAETYPELGPSIGVLERCGFRLVGGSPEDGTIRFAIDRVAWTRSLFTAAPENPA